MTIIIEIDEGVEPDSIDLVMDFVEACAAQGMEIDDIVASMLCAVSALLEVKDTDGLH
jgi:hypothetical protein